GVKKEDKFGHMILFGLGGIFIEVLKDVVNLLAPVSADEVKDGLKELKAYKMIQGTRGMEGVNEALFVDTVCRLSALVSAAPEISELDLNPLLGTQAAVVAVDARIKIEK
ncbi:MAG: acetate--CoA ligase family protein, partial [Bacteroidetes bacterium]|nr:acetate--CoA ligase family protein [Bacteroidota bacterium]